MCTFMQAELFALGELKTLTVEKRRNQKRGSTFL